MELLMRILRIVEDGTVIFESGVCTGWRKAICIGVQERSLSRCKSNMSNYFCQLLLNSLVCSPLVSARTNINSMIKQWKWLQSTVMICVL
jgi:hypothetical protein